jgi:hypothetical protein
VAFYLGEGRCPARTWRSLIGGGVRREWPGGTRQGEETGLRQEVIYRKARSMVRGLVRERPVDSVGGRRTYARQLFDEVLSNRARSGEGNRNRTSPVSSEYSIRG